MYTCTTKDDIQMDKIERTSSLTMLANASILNCLGESNWKTKRLYVHFLSYSEGTFANVLDVSTRFAQRDRMSPL